MNDLVAGAPARVLIALLVLVAASLLAYAALGRRRRADVGVALEPYTVEPLRPQAEAARFALAKTSLTRRGVDLTARLLRPSRLLPVLEGHLEKADWPVRGAEATFFYLLGAVVLTLLGAALGGFRTATLVLLASGLTPILVLRLAISRRRRAFESQLPDALRMLAGSLRAGRSLPQALQGLSEETSQPVPSELSRAVAEVRLGRTIEEAFEDIARRMGSQDARFVASAVRMQRQVGGNVADLLAIVAETMVERDRLRGEVKALTAEGRVSALVLGILPVALGPFLYAADPDYVLVLFRDPLGRTMLAAATGLAIAGFLWMRKTMEVDV